MSLFSDVPSIRAAVEEETETRDTAYLEAQAEICGVTVLPLTLRRYLLLCASRNAFVCGGVITPEECARFLWCVSDEYDPGKAGLPAFLDRLKERNYGEAVEGISGYLAFAFFDSPPIDNDTRDNPSYYSFATVYLDLFGREYGWSLGDVMDCPLPVLFQMLKRIQERNDPKAILFNPLSDKAKGDYVRELNTQ